jgi:hypothetical protein
MKARDKEGNFEKDKLEIIKWVTGLKDRTAIERIMMLKERPKKTDWWDQITEEERAAIDMGWRT